CTSSTSHAGVVSADSRKSSADENVHTRKPPAASRRRSARSSEASSSITYTSGDDVVGLRGPVSFFWASGHSTRSTLHVTIAERTRSANALLVVYGRADRLRKWGRRSARRNFVLRR